STYAVAYCVAQSNLSLKVAGAEEVHHTERGRILVFGGDQVYPTASRAEYKQRLVEPYKTALQQTDPPQPDVFAIPGNHDWYDSLVSFTRLFCSRFWFAGWRSPQSRSYFALRLPHGWWLLGIDVQFNSDIDSYQVEYFKKAAKEMRDGDRVILCSPEPHWIRACINKKTGYIESNLAFLENNVLEKRITAFLAGDLHYYRRHEAENGVQKIVAGGGGAFLSPTHGENLSELKGGFKLKASYPDEETSRRICYRNLIFPYWNRSFGILTAILYFLTSWTVMADIGHYGWDQMDEAMTTSFNTAFIAPGAVFWILTMLVGFILFTSSQSKLYQWIGGLGHGALHLFAMFFIGWGATYFSVSTLGLPFQSPNQLMVAAILIFVGGWIAGSFMVGIFLLISLNLFHCLHVSAFSSLAIQDWKNFLRLKIDENGDLTIYPIGIRRVPRKWKRRPVGTTGPEVIPDDPKTLVPELIEPPIRLKRKAEATRGGQKRVRPAHSLDGNPLR
nr:metallophosphoesterase [Acidobacteriota bacterium]